MATKILAHPMDDKRKAASVDLTFTSGKTDMVDIRGFANFTILVTTVLPQTSTILISHDNSDSTSFSPLNSLGAVAAAVADIPVAVDKAYDVPELAGCHYLRIDHSSGTASTGAITIMGKV